MLRKAAAFVAALIVVAAAIAWFLTSPEPLAAAQLPSHEPDLANGERMFYASGCTSCHAAPGAKGEEKLKLAGGLELVTDFGTFRVPNISPDAATGASAAKRSGRAVPQSHVAIPPRLRPVR